VNVGVERINMKETVRVLIRSAVVGVVVALGWTLISALRWTVHFHCEKGNTENLSGIAYLIHMLKDHAISFLGECFDNIAQPVFIATFIGGITVGLWGLRNKNKLNERKPQQ
jgi:hypothetical protein